MTSTSSFELQRVRVEQNLYAQTIAKIGDSLEKLRQTNRSLTDEGSQVILIVCPLLKDVEDDESPIFVFSFEELAEALPWILPWAESFQSQNLMLPKLTMVFGLGCLASKDFDSLMDNPGLFGPDGTMIVKKIKFWMNRDSLIV